MHGFSLANIDSDRLFDANTPPNISARKHFPESALLENNRFASFGVF